jgi:predicted RND superfamily exporter protein
MFAFFLACYIPGLKLAKEQKMMAIASFDMDLVGEFSEKVTGVLGNYYMLWCKGCDITKHPELYEDRGRALRVLQKVKRREHDCRDMTWSTHDDPAIGLNSTNYISPSKTVTFINIRLGDTGSKECTHKLGLYMADLRGQFSGDVKGGLAAPRNVIEGSQNEMTQDILKHQILLVPIMLLLMWSVCSGWWRSLTNIIISSWAAGASNAVLLVLKKIWPELELGFTAGIVPFVSLAFCTDYSIFFWTRLQKEREDNPSKEMYLQCIVTAIEKSGEVIVCSSVVIVVAYCSTAFYPKLNDMGFMAMNLQLACAAALCGIFSTIVVPAWAACYPSLFDNREPNSPNIIQRCLPAMMTTLPEGKHFWKTWTSFVTRGKMMIIIPILAYACMIPFVVCLGEYEPNYDVIELMKYPGTAVTSAYNHLNDHFGSGGSVKWIYVVKATEFGDLNEAGLLQVENADVPSTAEEVAFAQHAMKMSRKAHGDVLGDQLVMQPEFGQEVCKFSQQLMDFMREHWYQFDETKIDTLWYGKDLSGGEDHGCRSKNELAAASKSTGQSLDQMFGHLVHRKGEKLALEFYPGIEATTDKAANLYHMLRAFEKEASHEFVMGGKRYWFEAEHTSLISYLKDTGVMMKRACPWIMGWTAVLAFVGVGVMFKSLFLPFKFCCTVIVPIAAVFGLEIAVFQENWFGTDHLTEAGGILFLIPYIQIGLLFGLAMDYDIFLFARVYEYRQEGYDNVSSVQKSLVETGPIVMTAGTFMCLSFFMMMISGIMCMAQMAFLYFFGVFADTYFTCTCIAPCVLCWGEWLNFFPGYIPPVTRKYNVDEGCDDNLESS